MTDEQFKMLRAMQFAQLALLQSIDANIRSIAMQEKPDGAVGVNLAATRALIEQIKLGKKKSESKSQ